MAIDWDRFRYLAIDGPRTVWTYATDSVKEDAAVLDLALPMLRPKLPRHELVESKSGISVIFHGKPFKDVCYPYHKIRATIDRICDTIVDEGMGIPVAQKGKPE